jgi:hypothetical protein
VKDLPEFKRFGKDFVTQFANQVLAHPNQPEHSYFRRLIQYEDGHYGVVFSLDYFALADNSTPADAPTKSQWNSLKKKLKRHDKRVFVFKEHTIEGCNAPDDSARCGCLEFGFFAH